MTIPAPWLSDSDRRELLRIARVALREYLASGTTPPGTPHRETLMRSASVTVKLIVSGASQRVASLAESKEPVFKAIQLVAVAAATLPNLPALTRDELKQTIIEVELSGDFGRDVFSEKG